MKTNTMNDTTHTAAPWFRDGDDIYAQDCENHCTPICTVYADHEGNGNLLLAAPELLEALKWMVEDYETNEMSESITTAKLAISKAEGK